MGSAATTDRYGQYAVIRRIAVGGMAEIFEAHHDGDTERVALKVLLPHCAADADTVRAFEHEAALATALTHENLVRIRAHGRDGATAFLVMDYVDGGSLSDVLRASRRAGERLPVGLTLYVMRELLSALEYVHSAKGPDGEPLCIVHRDVTPQNILIDRGGRVRLGDFGIARSSLRDARTRTGIIKGKLRYLAPEQATGSALDARTDLYAVGLILFEMLTGAPYIEGDNEILLLRRAEAPEPRKASEVAEVALAFDPVLQRALERFPEQRFKTAAALQRALDGAAEAAGVAATEGELTAWIERALEVAPASPPELQTTPLGPGGRREAAPAAAGAEVPRPSTSPSKSPLGTLALVVGAVVAVGAVGYWSGVRRSGEAEPTPSAAPAADREPGSTSDLPSFQAPPPSAEPSVVVAPPGPESGASAAPTVVGRPSPASKPSAVADAGSVRPPASAAPDPASARAQAARARLDGAKRSLASRGLLTSDLSPSQRAEISAVEQDLSAGSVDAAEAKLDPLVASLGSVNVTADLVKKKLGSVSAALKAAKAKGKNTSQLDALVESALSDFAAGRHEAANRKLNEILGKLAQL